MDVFIFGRSRKDGPRIPSHFMPWVMIWGSCTTLAKAKEFAEHPFGEDPGQDVLFIEQVAVDRLSPGARWFKEPGKPWVQHFPGATSRSS